MPTKLSDNTRMGISRDKVDLVSPLVPEKNIVIVGILQMVPFTKDFCKNGMVKIQGTS